MSCWYEVSEKHHLWNTANDAEQAIAAWVHIAVDCWLASWNIYSHVCVIKQYECYVALHMGFNLIFFLMS